MTSGRKSSIYLVNPPAATVQRKGPIASIIRNLFFNSPPLGLAYIAAVLERAYYPVQILDAGVEQLDFAQTAARVLEANPDIVGIGSTTNFFGNALRLARQLKASRPGLFIILGGPHASSCSDTAMTHECFDVACIGEGEETMLELAEAYGSGADFDGIKGIAYRRNGEIHWTAPRPLRKDLDTLPLPARHLLPLDKYVPQPNDGPYLPKHAMISSRGCPYQCIFCDHGTYGVSYRSFSPERIADEMEELVYRYGARDIAFVDSLFMISKARVYNIVDEMLRRELNVHWTCTVRANVATREVLERMKGAGCWRVRVGVEAGNEEVLKFIKKGVSKAEVRAVTEAADALGLHPKAFFMIGHPTETEERIRESIDFACSLPLTDVTVQINTPLPGAEEWQIAGDYGSLTTEDWGRYSFWEPIYVPHGLTREKLDLLYREFYRRFYFRPVVVWRHLRMLKNLNDVKRFARAGGILLSMFSSKLETEERQP